jgi:hypothetical protein
VSYVHQALLNGVERLTGALQNGEQILLRDGAVGGVNEIPPATDGLLDLNLCLLAYDQGVNQTVHLALDGLIRDRNFLGHGILELLLRVGKQSSSQTVDGCIVSPFGYYACVLILRME